MKKRVLFCGGGTGGHIFPIVAIVRQLKKLSPKLEFFYSGPEDPFSAIYLGKEGIQCRFVLAGKIRRYFNFFSFFQNLFDLFFKTPLGILQSLGLLLSVKPSLVFAKGGFGSFPVVFAAKLLGKKIILHESDAEMGLANKILANFADIILISFPIFEKFPKEKRVIFVGHPVREELLEKADKEEAKKYFKITGEKPVVLVLGGSQGAERINEKILSSLCDFLEEFEILHQTGKRNFERVKRFADHLLQTRKKLTLYYHPFPFFEEEELRMAFSVADFVVSRAGAGTIAEILAHELPSVLIPLPEAAQQHQLKNAFFLEKQGAAILIQEENFTPTLLKLQIKRILSKPSLLDEMKENIKKLAKPKAASEIAKIILENL